MKKTHIAATVIAVALAGTGVFAAVTGQAPFGGPEHTAVQQVPAPTPDTAIPLEAVKEVAPGESVPVAE